MNYSQPTFPSPGRIHGAIAGAQLCANFSATITTAAWRTKPSWMLVAGSNRTINPDLERWYAKRAHSDTVEDAGASHSIYVSHPKEVADVIENAAHAVSK